MELNELKSLWQQYDVRLQKVVSVNNRLQQIIEARKIKPKLAPVFWQKGIETILHAAVILLLLWFLANNMGDIRYASSAVLLLAFYGIAISHSLRQFVIVNRIDYSQDIVTIQKDLATLQSSTLNYARLSILCIPTFLAYPPVISEMIKDLNLTYFADFDIIAKSHGAWWTAQLASSIVLVPVCFWMYAQLTRKNINKPWVRQFIARSSGTRVTSALEFINELEGLSGEASEKREMRS